MNKNTLPTIDLANLDTVTGGVCKLPSFKLPWWLSTKPFVIPAADPPGHTKELKAR